MPPLPTLLHEIAAALSLSGDETGATLVARIEQQAHGQQPTAAAEGFVDALAALEAWVDAGRAGQDTQPLLAGLGRAVERLGGPLASIAPAAISAAAVIGSSDATGAYPKERPIAPADIHASIYAALGYDYREISYRSSDGRPVALTEGVTIGELF